MPFGYRRPALWPNEGCYVLTRRFTTKEEKRRIVATLYESNLPGPQVGFENRLNVFHAARAGLPRALAAGLAVYLNSRLVDRYFRQFNGHTQVNAADLPYPSRATLERWRQAVAGWPLAPQAIEALIEEEVCQMSATLNMDPLRAQQKIEEALSILKALGLPRAQRNTRSALTLLALLNLRADGSWTRLERPRMGITPIMDFMRRHYGHDYAPHTRETSRRQTMQQFVAAALALPNPDPPDRPVNSPQTCYRISLEACQLLATFGTAEWEAALAAFRAAQGTLAARYAQARARRKIPVTLAGGQTLLLVPGAHGALIQQVLTGLFTGRNARYARRTATRPVRPGRRHPVPYGQRRILQILYSRRAWEATTVTRGEFRSSDPSLSGTRFPVAPCRIRRPPCFRISWATQRAQLMGGE